MSINICRCKDQVADLLDEDFANNKSRSLRRDLQQAQEKVREQKEHRERLSGKEKAKTWVR